MRLPISAAGPVIGPITPTLMVPVPLALLAPLELELVLVLLPPQAASASRAVTPAAAVRQLARERADNARADRWRPARGWRPTHGRLAAKRARGCTGAGLSAGGECGADAETGDGAGWDAGV